jgi:hypothetical protein
MILDKAPELIKAYPIRQADDGYGGLAPTHLDVNGVPMTPVEFYAFAIPVGFSGAGWAINSKITAQGWADVNRVRLIFKPVNGLVPMDKWSHLEFSGQEWTVQEVPRLIKGTRRSQDYVTATVELKGDL